MYDVQTVWVFYGLAVSIRMWHLVLIHRNCLECYTRLSGNTHQSVFISLPLLPPALPKCSGAKIFVLLVHETEVQGGYKLSEDFVTP